MSLAVGMSYRQNREQRMHRATGTKLAPERLSVADTRFAAAEIEARFPRLSRAEVTLMSALKAYLVGTLVPHSSSMTSVKRSPPEMRENSIGSIGPPRIQPQRRQRRRRPRNPRPHRHHSKSRSAWSRACDPPENPGPLLVRFLEGLAASRNVEMLRVGRRCSGSSNQSSMNRVRSIRPISRNARATGF